MSVPGLLIRFAGLYIALMVGIAVVFHLLEIKSDSGLNSGALIGSVFAVCLWFGNKNKRYMEQREKRNAFLGMWAIDLSLQVLVAVGVGAAAGTQLPVVPLLMALAFIGLLHGIGIYFAVGFAGKQYAKQAAKSA